ncbi:MAG: glyceraldehyde-3-phosphate dehydrogenase [Microbacterium sp.]|jgi:glyceraldehyde 3-phosphate dehydrogenase|nr:glyceraldehyde-3-phosphate dehydrogenase [Microbacterium sp.]
MPAKIAINGLGRIGRNQLRLMARRSDLEVVALNDPRGARAIAELLESDRVSGRPTGGARHDDRHLFLNGHAIRVYSEHDRRSLPWGELGVDIVLESTGRAVRADAAREHLAAGAEKVIMTSPAPGDDGTFVLGVNEGSYDRDRHHVVSSGSCTTLCLAPVLQVFDQAFGIETALMTTIHSGSVDDRLQDIPHADLLPAGTRGARITASSIGAAEAVCGVLPHLDGRLEGTALRAPSLTGSITHLTVTAKRAVTTDEVQTAYQAASEGSLQGILRCADDEIAVTDSVIDPHSSILDTTLIRVIGSQVKLSTWYDDEWGYSHRLTELVAHVAEGLTP